MNLSCPDCRTVYRVDPAKVPVAGVLAQCARCPGIMSVNGAADSGNRSDIAALDQSPGHAGEREAAREMGTRSTPGTAAIEGDRALTDRPDLSEKATGPSSWSAGASATISTESAPAPVQQASSGAVHSEKTGDVSPPSDDHDREDRGEDTGTETVFPDGDDVEEAVRDEPGEEAGTPGETPLPPPPFGSLSDPHRRATRLARALVSDIVVYHPDRRARSLRQGTLRQEFRDEIRKSWEEYANQVGGDFARQTTYFRDALNEILANGSTIF